MIVGCPKEIKNEEYRVGMTPNGVKDFVAAGHTVIVEAGAGVGSGFSDKEYKAAGATLAPVKDVFAKADMIYKVKEPLPEEWPMFKPGQILYTHLQKNNGGRGVLLGGVTGVPKAKVVIIGGGAVGTNAAKIAVGMGARVVMMDSYAPRLTYLDDVFGGAVETVLSTAAAIEEQIIDADIVVGGVLLPGGAQAPHLIKKSQLKKMQPGSVLVDVAIDQGGCFETSKPTTHTDPTYVIDGVIHYCVANMPGAVARTSTMALAGATLPFGLAIANKGFEQAVKDDAALALGVNVYRGKLTIPSVAEAHKMKYTPLDKVLA
jgi:alanine dehydrogenase